MHLDRVRGAQHVVVDVAEVLEQLGVDARDGAVGEPLQRQRERADGPAELRDLALELVDALGVLVVVDVVLLGAEHLQLDLVDVLVDRTRSPPRSRRRRGRRCGRAPRSGRARQVASRGVDLGPHLAQHVAVAVPDGHDEVAPEEDGDLGDVDDLVVVDVPHRLEDGEHDVAVDLELGPLVRLDGVLDGERRQPERLGDDRRSRRPSAAGARSRRSRCCRAPIAPSGRRRRGRSGPGRRRPCS